MMNKGDNMRKFMMFGILILSVFALGHAEILTSFPDMVKPTELRVDDAHIYISDQNSVFIYDKTTFKLVKKLSKKGEGPGELKNRPTISITSDGLILSDNRKIMIYSKAFDLKKEIKLHFSASQVNPIHDMFALIHSRVINNKRFRVFTLCNSETEKVKDLVIEPGNPDNIKYLLSPWSRCRTWKDKIFIAQPHKGFYIDVFDKDGKKLYLVEKKVEQITSQEKHRTLYMEEILCFVGRRNFERYKARGLFNKPMKKFVPVMNNFWVLDDRLYVKTYDITDTKEKFIIMDLEGNILKTVFLPKSYREILTFNNDKFYYLEDNEDKNCWVLHAVTF
jgi:hypothetical protein